MLRMTWGMTVAAAVVALAALAFRPIEFAAADQIASVQARPHLPEDAYAQRRPRRAPTRIRVTPLHYELGPNAVRQCTAWLATEYRPSGTVVVPRMRCWWEPR
jgi:hypothetical protein